ncbi:MAG TPA: hypothetical protein VJ885_02885, partial [Thermoanaerobaculia bacterium]|nr:hypothetical protein [Thermoanaerobaculia bacterium]
ENLDKVPEFEEPTLKDTQEQAGGVYKFVVEFKYSFAPLAEEAGGTADGTAPAVAATAPTSGV